MIEKEKILEKIKSFFVMWIKGILILYISVFLYWIIMFVICDYLRILLNLPDMIRWLYIPIIIVFVPVLIYFYKLIFKFKISNKFLGKLLWISILLSSPIYLLTFISFYFDKLWFIPFIVIFWTVVYVITLILFIIQDFINIKDLK
jgi:hypothetical protein